MPFYRLFSLIALIGLLGTQQLAPSSSIVYGPYNGAFIPDGLGLKKAINADDSPLQGTSSWSIYCWVMGDAPVNSRTLLAGFGDPRGEPGTQRYFSLRSGKLSFWAGNDEITTETKLVRGKWQFISATFDGTNLTLYSGGVKLAANKLSLSTAAPILHLAPATLTGPDTAHFAGRIAGFTLISRALTSDEIRTLAKREPRFELIQFEPGSRTWPVQTRGQDGLRAPQEQSTLPHSVNAYSRPLGKSAKTNTAQLVPRGDNEWALNGGWQLIEAPRVKAGGSIISQVGFKAKGWLDATVPGTVLSTLIDRGIFPDPDFGLNNLTIPEDLNKQDYWYRTEFRPHRSLRGQRLTLTLHGINYAAQVWLNGNRIGELKGAFQRGEFDFTTLVTTDGPNALAVFVSPPPHPGIPHEQSIIAGPGPNGGAMCLDGPTFVCTEGWDWLPAVRDRNTGIWQEVTLKATGPVKIGDVHVITKLPSPDTSRASVTITVPLSNNSRLPRSGLLEVSFEGVTVRRKVIAPPGKTGVLFSPAEFAQLNVNHPRLWWPNGYGSPELYHLKVRFTAGSSDSDLVRLRFGIREVSYELTLFDNSGRLQRVEYSPTVASHSHQHVVNVSHKGMVESAEGWVASFMPGGEGSEAVRRLEDRRASPFLVIRVNGVRIAIKGGNWGLDDSRKRVSRERLEPFFRLHRDANLNMIRNWSGQNTEEVFFDLADEYGLLVWSDFWLSTQEWNLEPTDPSLFLANARDTLLRFRNHPSIAIWCGRNEGVPPPFINDGLDELIRTQDGTRYYIPNSRSINLQDSGPWIYGDPSTYFVKRGLGFSTEIGLPSPPSAETMRAMLGEADQWPPNDVWAYHDWHSKGGAEVVPFMKAMEEELGAPTSLDEFDRKAQLMNYVSHRAMFEGFNSRLWSPNSGRLIWMTHPARPSMVWQMYSSDYGTYGAYYGVKKASEPLHVQLNQPGLETAIVNNRQTSIQNLRLNARIFSADGVELFSHEERLSAPAGRSTQSFRLNMPPQASDGVVFVKLELRNETGLLLSENFYWYSEKKSGYQQLNDMAPAIIEGAAFQIKEAGQTKITVELKNQSPTIALATQVTLRDSVRKTRVLPAYLSDNFVSLLPGEKKEIIIDVPGGVVDGDMDVAITGWNVREASVPVRTNR